MVSRSGGTTKRQFARDMATTSPEPCQGMGETIGGPGEDEVLGVREPGSRCWDGGVDEVAKAAAGLPHSIMAGRKWVRPGFSESRELRMASMNGSGRGSVPERMSIAGRTKSSKVTIVETGLPGRPKTGLPLQSAKTTGLPGRMATASKIVSAPNSFRTGSTRSYFPIETPPERMSRSDSRPVAILARRSSRESFAFPRMIGSPPESKTCAASETELLLRIWYGPGGDAKSTI